MTGTLADTVGQYNPFRYRSYYYDAETGLYYLQSRYYDPEVGRFINADGIVGANGGIQAYNLFAYCNNNPVMYDDPSGYMVSKLLNNALGNPSPSGEITGASGGSIVTGVLAAVAATALLYRTESLPKKYHLENKANNTEIRNNYVYILKDETTVQYVGRTNDPQKRMTAHSNNPARENLTMEIIASGLSLAEARAVEQAAMEFYHTINTSNKMNNQINSIAPKYWDVFKVIAEGVLEYSWNNITNEILYWTGN